MIESLVKDKKVIKENDKILIFSYERIIIPPNTRRIITLPYKRVNLDKYLILDLDKTMASNGLQILWTNLNEESSLNCFELIILNNNFDKEAVFNFKDNPIAQVVGSNQTIDIRSNTLLGKIFII